MFVVDFFLISNKQTNASCSVKWGLNARANSFDSGQPAQSAQADLSRNFLQLDKFSALQRTSLLHGSVVCETIIIFMDR